MELRKVDMPPCNGRYYITRDGKEIYTTSTGNRHTVGKIEYAGITLYKLKELKPGSKGYCSVKVFDLNEDKRVQVGIHRMVAYAWCNPPNNWEELEVDHIDGETSNNNADNLRWCSHRDNILYAQERGAWSHNNKPVVCFETGETFPSAKAAFEKYKKPNQKSMSGLADVLKGRAVSWHNKHFAYADKAEWL